MSRINKQDAEELSQSMGTDASVESLASDAEEDARPGARAGAGSSYAPVRVRDVKAAVRLKSTTLGGARACRRRMSCGIGEVLGVAESNPERVKSARTSGARFPRTPRATPASRIDGLDGGNGCRSRRPLDARRSMACLTRRLWPMASGYDVAAGPATRVLHAGRAHRGGPDCPRRHRPRPGYRRLRRSTVRAARYFDRGRRRADAGVAAGASDEPAIQAGYRTIR